MIAVVGGGLAGLSAAWHLLQRGFSVDIFDSSKESKASNISVGLLHPYPGKANKLSEFGHEAMQASLDLLQSASNHSHELLFQKTGIFRPILEESQRNDWTQAVEQHRDLCLQTKAPFDEGLWIEVGTIVHLPAYLLALKSLCHQARYFDEKIESLESLAHYDRIVIAAGYGTFSFLECVHLPLKATKGQALVCEISQSYSFPLNSHVHITPMKHPQQVQIGSTYERQFDHCLPDMKKASVLKEKAAKLDRALIESSVISLDVGIRVSPKEGHVPMIEKISQKVWVMTGFGSRGLLYHALYGDRLAQMVSLSLRG